MKSLKTIVENIMSCNYKCEEGDLSQNPDFHALMSLAGIPIHYVIEKTPTQFQPPVTSKREHLVEFAKQYIEDLKARSGLSWEYENVSTGYNAQYIVNPLKRTVVCLLRGYMDGKVIKRGIAKCSSNDCFNEHIGKAIALSRALGKETPVDFLSASKADGFGVGDIVESSINKSYLWKITKITDENYCETVVHKALYGGADSEVDKSSYCDCNFDYLKVIDDSARY